MDLPQDDSPNEESGGEAVVSSAPSRLTASVELTDELLSDVSGMSCCSSKEEAREGLVRFFEEVNDPKQLALILDALDYFNV